MTRNRLYMFAAIAAMLVVAVAGYFVGVQPQLARASTDDAQRQSVVTANASNNEELARLKAQAVKLPEMRDRLAALEASVPSDADMSSFYGELNAVAGATGVTISSITTSDALAYTSPTAAEETTAPAGSTATAEPSSSASASASPSAQATSPGVTTNGQITASNFSAIPVAVSIDGSFDQALEFARGVQSGARLFLIDAVSSAASSSSTEDGASGTTWTFGGYVYVLSKDANVASGAPANG